MYLVIDPITEKPRDLQIFQEQATETEFLSNYAFYITETVFNLARSLSLFPENVDFS